MSTIEEMMLRQGIIKFGNYQISGSLVNNNLAVYDGTGRQTHRVESAVLGGGTEAVVYSLDEHRVVSRIKFSAQAA